MPFFGVKLEFVISWHIQSQPQSKYHLSFDLVPKAAWQQCRLKISPCTRVAAHSCSARPAQLSTWSGKHSEQITRKKKKKSIHALQTNLCRDVYMGVVYTHIHRQESNFLTQFKCSHTTRRFQHNREVEVQFCTARTSHQQVKWWLYPPHRYCQ